MTASELNKLNKSQLFELAQNIGQVPNNIVELTKKELVELILSNSLASPGLVERDSMYESDSAVKTLVEIAKTDSSETNTDLVKQAEVLPRDGSVQSTVVNSTDDSMKNRERDSNVRQDLLGNQNLESHLVEILSGILFSKMYEQDYRLTEFVKGDVNELNTNFVKKQLNSKKTLLKLGRGSGPVEIAKLYVLCLETILAVRLGEPLTPAYSVDTIKQMFEDVREKNKGIRWMFEGLTF
jgi:hypothetical protein